MAAGPAGPDGHTRTRGVDNGVAVAGCWRGDGRRSAANVKIASCVAEALERTLRRLAPDADVLAWHAETGRPAADLDARGGPTHALRARYALRSTDKRRQRLAANQVEALVAQVPDVRGLLQAGKHASAHGVTLLRSQLVAVEALLHQLTLPGGS